ncbi:unnamed protein product [Adineta ricciae]|uniref:Uncharacterized protein n=1 Tax=Adineta ricciae TaxID=249248 RepID=A0A814Z6S7_ADIRI|nr:unnamed protein product [Adineta ricciae]
MKFKLVVSSTEFTDILLVGHCISNHSFFIVIIKTSFRNYSKQIAMKLSSKFVFVTMIVIVLLMVQVMAQSNESVDTQIIVDENITSYRPPTRYCKDMSLEENIKCTFWCQLLKFRWGFCDYYKGKILCRCTDKTAKNFDKQ